MRPLSRTRPSCASHRAQRARCPVQTAPGCTRTLWSCAAPKPRVFPLILDTRARTTPGMLGVGQPGGGTPCGALGTGRASLRGRPPARARSPRPRPLDPGPTFASAGRRKQGSSQRGSTRPDQAKGLVGVLAEGADCHNRCPLPSSAPCPLPRATAHRAQSTPRGSLATRPAGPICSRPGRRGFCAAFTYPPRLSVGLGRVCLFACCKQSASGRKRPPRGNQASRAAPKRPPA